MICGPPLLDQHSPAPTILQRLPFSSDYHSTATAILPTTAILQRLLLLAPFEQRRYTFGHIYAGR
jgi:hypothetical protein